MDIFEKWDHFVKQSNNKDSLREQGEYVLYILNEIINDRSLDSVVSTMDEKTLNQFAEILRKAYLTHKKNQDWTTPR